MFQIVTEGFTISIMLHFSLIGLLAWFSLSAVWTRNPGRPRPRVRVSVSTPHYGEEWWYSMGRAWETSEQLARQNPFLAAHHHGQLQMLLHSWAPHVGRIYRGQFVTPGLNRPGDRSFGFQSDFHLHELASEAGNFRFRPRGQRVRAQAVRLYSIA